jgi:cupin 2 domain-containing protein
MPAVARGRLPEPAGAPATGERVDEVAVLDGVTIEHLASGRLPDPVAYLQDHGEWALVLTGAAVLEVEGGRLRLEARDWVWLPEGVPHTLVWTEPGTEWLAVHLPPASGEA